MTTAPANGLRLVYPDGRTITGLDAIDADLRAVGARVWPLDHSNLSDELQGLIAQDTLTDAENARLMEALLLPRERLLEIVEAAGRAAQVPGGGEMVTTVVNHGYDYPQLYLVEPGVDYSRFDRYHVNVADDGTGVDEVMQVLSGSGTVLLQHLPGHDGAVTLHMDCPENGGWMVTYDGAYPHIGSISGATPGSKILMQVIGPREWKMVYEDETPSNSGNSA